MNALFTMLLYFKAKMTVMSILGYPMKVFVSKIMSMLGYPMKVVLNIPWFYSSLGQRQMLKFLIQDTWICMRTGIFEMLLGRVKERAGDCMDNNLWAIVFNFTQILLWVSVLYWDPPSTIYTRSIIAGVSQLLCQSLHSGCGFCQKAAVTN